MPEVVEKHRIFGHGDLWSRSHAIGKSRWLRRSFSGILDECRTRLREQGHTDAWL